MSYATAKGRQGEHEIAGILNKYFEHQGYKLIRIGGVEANKSWLAGDVVVSPKNKKKGCLLEDFFIESKKKARIDFWGDSAKAKDDAESSGKKSYILFVQQQERGSKVGERRLACLEPEVLSSLLGELQGFRDAEKPS